MLYVKKVSTSIKAIAGGLVKGFKKNREAADEEPLEGFKSVFREVKHVFRRLKNPKAEPDRPFRRVLPPRDPRAPPSEKLFATCLYNATHPSSRKCVEEDVCENHSSMITAVQEGVKVRDFAFAPEPVLGIKPLASGALIDERVPVLFIPTRPYYEFWYMYQVYEMRQEFDMPAVHVTPDDIDRLYTIGWITLRDVRKFAIGRELLGAGLMRRRQREVGLPMEDGKLVPVHPWTIAPNVQKPTQKALYDYFLRVEHMRQDRGLEMYPININERPMFCNKQDTRHLLNHGVIALKKKGISNELSIEYLKQRDVSFIPPGSGSSFVHPPPGKRYSDYAGPAVIKDIEPPIFRDHNIPAKFAHPEPLYLLETVSINQWKEPLSANRPPLLAPGGCEASSGNAQPSTPCSKNNKRKRAETDDEGSARRTRQRFISEKTANEDRAPRTRSRTRSKIPRSGRSSCTSDSESTDKKGKKRTREGTSEAPGSADEEIVMLPPKRRKANDGTAKSSGPPTTQPGADAEAPDITNGRPLARQNTSGMHTGRALNQQQSCLDFPASPCALEQEPRAPPSRQQALLDLGPPAPESASTRDVRPLSRLRRENLDLRASVDRAEMSGLMNAGSFMTPTVLHSASIGATPLTRQKRVIDIHARANAEDEVETDDEDAPSTPVLTDNLSEEEYREPESMMQLMLYDREDWHEFDEYFDSVGWDYRLDEFGHVEIPPSNFHCALPCLRREELWEQYEGRRATRIYEKDTEELKLKAMQNPMQD